MFFIFRHNNQFILSCPWLTWFTWNAWLGGYFCYGMIVPGDQQFFAREGNTMGGRGVVGTTLQKTWIFEAATSCPALPSCP